MPHDPLIYEGTAEFYRPGRPPYSYELVDTLRRECGLDGTGPLLDIGCGPGFLTLEIAHLFGEAIGLDADAAMLAEAARFAEEMGIANANWIEGLGEDAATLAPGPFRMISFSNSFHWFDREALAEIVYELLAPGGWLVLVSHAHAGRPIPPNPGAPPIPHDAIRALIASYLGARRRAGSGFIEVNDGVLRVGSGAEGNTALSFETPDPQTERHEDVLARTRFGRPRIVYAAGRPDIIQDADGVLANYHSTSFAAPHLFGERLEAFRNDLARLLADASPSGLFWDWPGDTEVVLARRPGPAQRETGFPSGTHGNC